ncbi:hypothetical protein C8J56DRAFT_844273, partial [Mycena floridula]
MPVPDNASVSPTSSDLDEGQIDNSDLMTPSSIHSGSASPTLDTVEDIPDVPLTASKKKKKKKPKKSAKAKEAANQTKAADSPAPEGRPTVLCISRNKHWRYISSYHGPWLQLPLELLESLLVLNLDPATLTASEPKTQSIPLTPSHGTPSSSTKLRDRPFPGLNDFSPPDSPRTTFATLPLPPPMPSPKPGKATPPPIDPGVFRSVTSIRRLIDEAAELSVRASSGLSAAELGSMRNGGGGGLGNSPWAAAQTLGINPLGNTGGGGRNVAMSAMRIHRLRALAVQKLAQAYKADEIASSVMVMQGGSVFDDVAERVLKVDPNDVDAKYVHFFHEKIPSRKYSQLAESTTTQVLDELIQAQPQRLEFYRTRGIVHCFRDEYSQATKDFTYALKEARAVRKAKLSHGDRGGPSESRTKGKKKKGKTNGQAPPSGTSASEPTVDGLDGEPLLLHPSVLADAPEPIEPQLLFLRGATFLQQAVFLIESAVLKLEEIRKVPSVDGAELRLCYIENGKYGGVEVGNPDGPLGKDGAKLQAYRRVLAAEPFQEQILGLLKKSVRDHERFLAHFDTLDSSGAVSHGDLAQQIETAFILSESIRPGNHTNMASMPEAPTMFTTYHPLLVESHFSILICQLMQADFAGLLPTFIKTAALVDGLEGYPVFLPPRSMAQAEFVEVLERLAGGWKLGIQPHSFSRLRSKGRLAIEAPPKSPVLPALSQTNSSSSINGSSSSNLLDGGSTSQAETEAEAEEPAIARRPDADEALDSARILLAPVLNRQKERAEKAAADKASGSKKKTLSINIPLHGPRVEVILAWLAAVHLPELE